MSNWRARYTEDGVFLNIDKRELPVLAHCKKKLIAFHIHWNFLNKRLVYFSTNYAGIADNNGTVTLHCIKKNCAYYLNCRKAKIELFGFAIEYYRVEKSIDHTCTPIAPLETNKLKIIFEYWKDKKRNPSLSFSV